MAWSLRQRDLYGVLTAVRVGVGTRRTDVMRLGRNRGKFGNVRTAGPGGVYDSKAEATRAGQLVLLQKAGKILSWERGKRVMLIDLGPGRRVSYRPDFVVHGLTEDWTEDVKGRDKRTGNAVTMTEAFRVKALLYAAKKAGPPLYVVDMNGNVLWDVGGEG